MSELAIVPRDLHADTRPLNAKDTKIHTEYVAQILGHLKQTTRDQFPFSVALTGATKQVAFVIAQTFQNAGYVVQVANQPTFVNDGVYLSKNPLKGFLLEIDLPSINIAFNPNI